MRLWSIHPEYLDSKGLVALWREALLAKHVLKGMTKGYTRHPQLERFRKSDNPEGSIDQYLLSVFEESVKRGFAFDRQKIGQNPSACKINVTTGQLKYELSHLLKKLQRRDSAKYIEVSAIKNLKSHPLFSVTDGDIEDWEKLQ